VFNDYKHKTSATKSPFSKHIRYGSHTGICHDDVLYGNHGKKDMTQLSIYYIG